MFCEVVLTFELAEEVLTCDHSNESYWTIFSRDTVYYDVPGDSNFWVGGRILSVTIQMKGTERYFPVVLFVMTYQVVLTFETMEEILKCDHSNKNYWAILSCKTVYYVVYKAAALIS